MFFICYFKNDNIIKLREVIAISEFRVEYLIAINNEKNIKLSNLSKEDMKLWKRNMEAFTLSEYYGKKIKITDNNFDFMEQHI